MEWVSQALPSSMPFRSAYLFNILQLFFVTILVINDTRLSHMDTIDALNVHPQGNSESSIGNVVGKFLAFSIVNVLSFVFCGLLNLLFYSNVFNIRYYFFYWLTLNLPTLVFCLGLSTLVVRLTKNQGLSVILLTAILGVLTLPGSVWLNGLFDPLATRIPNMFSDFTGHVNLTSYLLQRGFILFLGIIFAVFAVFFYPRIPNDMRMVSRLAWVALFPLFFAVGFAVFHGFQSSNDKREAFWEVYSRYYQKKVLKIVDNKLHLKETENGGIAVTSRMTVENKDDEELPLILYLNPGLVISSVTVDGENIKYQRELQVLLADWKVSPGETKEVIVKYEGKIDNSFCFLDTPEEKYASPAVNTIDIYHFGYSPAFCEKGYKLLTPECAWYPVSVPPYDASGFRRAMFTRYKLEVGHNPNLVAICQGEANRETLGKTTFTFEHDMKGISLCVGNYKKREIVVGSDEKKWEWDESITDFKRPKPAKDENPTRVELFYLPGHEYMLDIYNNIPKEEWSDIIESAKVSIGFYGNNNNYAVKRMMNKIAVDPTLQYPYSWITIVEVPCAFHVFTGKALQEGERVQGGMIFLPEKKYSVDMSFFSDNKKLKTQLRSYEEPETQLWFDNEFQLFERGSYGLESSGMGNTSFVYSDECPLINDVLFLTFYPELIWKHGTNEAKVEYYIVDYLKDHSLEEALNDPLLSQELLDKIIRKKCAELNALLAIQIGKKEFNKAYHDFLKQHLFEEAIFEDFSQEIFARFNVRLDSIVVNWFRSNELPLFEIDGRTISVRGERGCSTFDFKVFNRGKVPGIIKINGDHPGWIIPAGEGRAIKMRVSNVINFNVNTLLSLNVPGYVELSNERRDVYTDTTTWYLPLDSTSFLTGNENEVVVDDSDPGFTILETRKFNIASFFGQVETRAKYYAFAPAEHWGFTINKEGYGFPVKGAYFKFGGKGNQKVQWEADLPEGAYEVFCYQPFERNRISDFLREYYYTVFDGKEEHEVVLSMSKDDGGWLSLGVFDFHGKGRVTLSDRDRKRNSADKDSDPQVVVADAIKWVKVQK
ncbi:MULTISPECIES: hypothetical protein [unclassified Butyricimonas]|uniref:golvesin C-terminal-like domain-containing protein n=1 Tax=unclassified Butyricimonas TaxID=2637652 RepID=UPI001145D107|nr:MULTISPECIES: hypothetical protein [unclassified Butyricimonas]